jgi:polyketide synthase 12
MKSNVGHTQAASGVAGLIKMVMAIRHELLPQTLHIDRPSQHVDWSTGAVSLLTHPQPWARNGEPRRAALHSFGMSGTNVHMILEEPTPPQKHERRSAPHDSADGETALPWLVSGRGEQGLRRQARRMAEFAEQRPEFSTSDIGYALAVRRPALSHRAFVAGSNHEQLAQALRDIADGRTAPLAGEDVGANTSHQVALVCGSEQPPRRDLAMALIERAPAFAAEFGRIDDAFADWSLRDALHHAPTATDADVRVVEALEFAITASLAALWRACGVKPSAVVGQGRGELGAAYISGALTLHDAVAILVHRDQHPISAAKTALPLWSASAGDRLPADRLDRDHWSRAFGQSAPLDQVVASLASQGCHVFLELAAAKIPHDQHQDIVVVTGAPANDNDRRATLTWLAQQWVSGLAVDWRAVLAAVDHETITLPTYAFDRRRHWIAESPLWSGDGPLLELRHQVRESPLDALAAAPAQNTQSEIS